MRHAAFAAAMALATASQAQPTGQAGGPLERDLRALEAWLPGEFDNAEQWYFAQEQKVALPPRIHAAVTAVGAHAFRIVHSADNDPTKVIDDRTFTASVDAATGGLKLTAPGCEIRLKRQANQFVGGTEAGQCGDRASRAMVITDREVHRGPIRLQRAQMWTCWMAVPRSETPGDWFFAPGLKLSDQGGEVFVTSDGPSPQGIGYRLRQVDWPTGANQNALTLYVLRKGEDRAAGYSWANPEATRIGVNLRWMQGSCSRPNFSGPGAP